MKDHLLGLGNEDLERRIYRILPFYRLIEMLANNKNYLLAPSKWYRDDPFENMIKNIRYEHKGKTGPLAFANDVYAQCWSLTSSSHALWKIYTNYDSELKGFNVNTIEELMPEWEKIYKVAGVRIRTTIGAVLEETIKSKTLSGDDIYIGKVEYMKEHEIYSFLKKHNILSGDPKDIARVLLLKRSSFSYENEIRLILNDNDRVKTDVVGYEVDIKKIIESVALDPRISSDIVIKEMKKKIRKHAKGIPIYQSKLYKLPSEIVKIL